jgi:hypothetical protein
MKLTNQPTGLKTRIYRLLFPFRAWIKLRDESEDQWGEKLCYCGHTHRCYCSDPDKKLFKESVKKGTITLWDPENGWRKID